MTRSANALVGDGDGVAPEIQNPKSKIQNGDGARRVRELFLEQLRLTTQLENDLTRWAELAERIEG